MDRHKTGLAAFALAMLLLSGNAFAAMDISPEKIASYAHLYPDVFQDGMQPVSRRGGTPRQSEAVTLLMKSFNGDTDVQALNLALNTKDALPVAVEPLKSETQLKALFAASGLSWQDYHDITHALANDPDAFSKFMTALDKERANRSFLGRALADPGFLRSLQGETGSEHQIIVRNLLTTLKSTSVK